MKLAKLNSGYIKTPQQIFSLGLSHAGQALLLKLIDLPEDFNPTYSFLEKQLKMSRATLVRQFKILRDAQVINLIKKGTSNRPSVYEFNPPKIWQAARGSERNTSSVLRNRLMQRGRLVSGKELNKKRAGCPDGQHVDFIVPIVHPDVCGLNVPWNIQFLTWNEITRKGNSFDGTNDNKSWRSTKSGISSG